MGAETDAKHTKSADKTHYDDQCDNEIRYVSDRGRMMKAIFTPASLADHPIVYAAIGDEWLKRRITVAIEGRRRRNDLSPSAMGMSFGKLVHPLIAESYEAVNSDADVAAETPLLDLLELDINDLGNAVPSDLGQRLRLEDQATKIMYELHIGAGFVRLGHEIRWLPDRGEKRPEMIVDTDSLTALSVECKKRDAADGYEQAASQFWNHFQHALRQRMDDSMLNLWAKVTSSGFALGDVDRVVKAAVTAMCSNDGGSIEVMDGRYKVDYVRLAAPGGSIPSELLEIFPRQVYGVNAGMVTPSQVRKPRYPGDAFATGPIKDPKVLRLELVDDPAHRITGVLRNLKSASKQVLLGLPGIVYIDANLGNYQRETAEFDGIVARVRDEMQKAHTRISAVVLTDIYPSRTMDSKLRWWVRSEFIPQSRPQYPLPASLRFPGDESGSRWIRGEWFVVP